MASGGVVAACRCSVVSSHPRGRCLRTSQLISAISSYGFFSHDCGSLVKLVCAHAMRCVRSWGASGVDSDVVEAEAPARPRLPL